MSVRASARTLRPALKKAWQVPVAGCRANGSGMSGLTPVRYPWTTPQLLQACPLHSTPVLMDDGTKGGESENLGDGDAKSGNQGMEGEDGDESNFSPIRPTISMSDMDKPDFMDLADLIMSGTSYEDAVKGTDFDCLDQETKEEYDEIVRRSKALREGQLEKYLESTGALDLLEEVNALRGKQDNSETTSAPVQETRKTSVEMAQGKWAEILVHTDRVTKTVKGGMEIQYRALVTVGNLNGVGGFAIGKAITPGEAITEASRKAKLLHNLVYVERFKQASLCHDVMGKHNGSRVQIWARPPGSGMRAGKLSRDILYNMGITDAACKIIGRRNKYSMIYAFFDALAKHRGIEDFARGRGKRILSLQREMAGQFA